MRRERLLVAVVAAATTIAVALLALAPSVANAQSSCLLPTCCNQTMRDTIDNITNMPYCVIVGLVIDQGDAARYLTRDVPLLMFNASRSLFPRTAVFFNQTVYGYDGGLDGIRRNEFDVYIADLWSLTRRAPGISWSVGYTREFIGLGFLIDPPVSPEFLSLFDPLQGIIWGLAVVLIVVGGVLLFMVEWLHPVSDDVPPMGGRIVYRFAFVRSLLRCFDNSFKTPFSSGRFAPVSTAGALIIFGMKFFFLIFCESYTANLASSLTVSGAASRRSLADILKLAIIAPGNANVDFAQAAGGKTVALGPTLPSPDPATLRGEFARGNPLKLGSFVQGSAQLMYFMDRDCSARFLPRPFSVDTVIAFVPLRPSFTRHTSSSLCSFECNVWCPPRRTSSTTRKTVLMVMMVMTQQDQRRPRRAALTAVLVVAAAAIALAALARPVEAACSLAGRTTTANNGLPWCVRVGLLSLSPNADGTQLSDTQQYWANRLPRRVWNNVKRAISVRNVTIEEVQTTLDWESALDAVALGTYDVFISNFWVLASRARRVDYAITYMKESWGLMYRTPPAPDESPIVNWGDPFTAEVWIVSAAVLMFGAIMMCAVELINHGFGGDSHQTLMRPDEEMRQELFSMLRDADALAYLEALQNGMSHAFGAVFGTADVVPRSFGGWLVSWAIAWFVFVLLASYTANLATFLTLRKPIPPRSASELLSLPALTVSNPEMRAMLAGQTFAKSVQAFTSTDYIGQFRASNVTSAALPELDLREIALRNCDLSFTTTDLNIESAFIMRQADSMNGVKSAVDEAVLQFADFGILKAWVDSGLPPDECSRDAALANKGAMGLPELGGALVFAAILFGVGVAVGVLTWLRDWWSHRHVLRKYGHDGPHRSDDIQLSDGAVHRCRQTVSDAKRASAALVALLATPSSEPPPTTKAASADWRRLDPVPPMCGSGGVVHEQNAALRRLLLALNDGIVPGELLGENNSMDSDGDNDETDGVTEHVARAAATAAVEGGGATGTCATAGAAAGDGAAIAGLGASRVSRQGAIAGHHLARIRGSVAAVCSALVLAEDAHNRAGRRRYCMLPIDVCNSRDGRADVSASIAHGADARNQFSTTEDAAAFGERMGRERAHIHAILEGARGATKAAAAVVEAAEVALLSSMMQQGKRRCVLERWLRRAFRATAFLTVLIASCARRIANESVYVGRMYLQNKRGALSEVSEMAALIATEVESIIRSVLIEEDDDGRKQQPPQQQQQQQQRLQRQQQPQPLPPFQEMSISPMPRRESMRVADDHSTSPTTVDWHSESRGHQQQRQHSPTHRTALAIGDSNSNWYHGDGSPPEAERSLPGHVEPAKSSRPHRDVAPDTVPTPTRWVRTYSSPGAGAFAHASDRIAEPSRRGPNSTQVSDSAYSRPREGRT